MTNNYQHYNEQMVSRLDSFWGDVDKKINAKITQSIVGERVLDLGCGFGSLTKYIHDSGYDVIGTDLLDVSINAAEKRYPNCKFLQVEDEHQPFKKNSIDTVILRDVIHHIKDESDVALFVSEINRITNHRIIICDPNPQPILRFSRRLINHVDPECTSDQALELFSEHFKETGLDYSILFSLPVSGGYVGKQMVPNFIGKSLLGLEGVIERFLHEKILKKLSWRYFLVLDKKNYA